MEVPNKVHLYFPSNSFENSFWACSEYSIERSFGSLSEVFLKFLPESFLSLFAEVYRKYLRRISSKIPYTDFHWIFQKNTFAISLRKCFRGSSGVSREILSGVSPWISSEISIRIPSKVWLKTCRSIKVNYFYCQDKQPTPGHCMIPDLVCRRKEDTNSCKDYQSNWDSSLLLKYCFIHAHYGIFH